MSDFQKSIFQNRLRQAEKSLGFSLDEVEDEIEEDEEEEESGSFGELPTFDKKPDLKPRQEDLDLPSWSDYFEKNDIYRDPKTGYYFQTYYTQPRYVGDKAGLDDSPVVFITHHGAGSDGLSFAKLSSSLKKQCHRQQIETYPGFLTFDMRGHANTHLLNQTNPDNMNISIDQLCKDFIFLITEFYNQNFASIPGSKPSFFLVGHSLGGAVLTKVVYDFQNEAKDGTDPELILAPQLQQLIKGLTMVDIVGDTAIKALGSMNSYLSSMPNKFTTMKKAIDWHINSKLLNNYQSALISVPGLLRKSPDDGCYRWVVDLRLSERYWVDWFSNLSFQFTAITNRVSKLLILANNDYLDKDLIIGQMQGKYQLIVFYNNQLNLRDTLTTATKTIESDDAQNLGHFVHEDIPDKVAASLLDFVERNDQNSMTRAPGSTGTSQIDLLNKLNAKWGVKK